MMVVNMAIKTVHKMGVDLKPICGSKEPWCSKSDKVVNCQKCLAVLKQREETNE